MPRWPKAGAACPPERVVVVRNAPDVAAYRALAAGIEPNGPRVGYIGVMGSQDGIGTLIDAWAAVVARPALGSAVLELVGDGEARPALERQVDALGLRSNVRFHGYLGPDRFVPILAACDLTVSPDPPTPFNDVSTMVKVLDSLVIGRPVVAFDLQETRRLIGEGGVIVEPPTAAALAGRLADLLEDPEAVRRMAAAAAARPEVVGDGLVALGGRARRRLRPAADGQGRIALGLNPGAHVPRRWAALS